MKNKINTIADIADLVGVSKSTVSRALNNSPLISDKTRKKIQDVAREYRFEAHKGAQSLSLKRSRTLALISPLGSGENNVVNDPYYMELLKGVIQASTIQEYDLLIGQPVKNPSGGVLSYLQSNRTDGVMVIGCGIKHVLDAVAGKGAVITAGADAPDNLCSVDCDNYTGGLLATQHLIQQGCKHIAFLGGMEDSGETKLRYQGYLDAMEKAGVSYDRRLNYFGDYSGRAGYQKISEWLSGGLEFDGLFSCSDLMAMGAIEAIREKGGTPGRNVAVVGFDDIPMAEYCSPPLTTIRQDIQKIGQTMVDHLIQNINDGIITKTILPVELVIRQSSGFNR